MEWESGKSGEGGEDGVDGVESGEGVWVVCSEEWCVVWSEYERSGGAWVWVWEMRVWESVREWSRSVECDRKWVEL